MTVAPWLPAVDEARLSAALDAIVAAPPGDPALIEAIGAPYSTGTKVTRMRVAGYAAILSGIVAIPMVATLVATLVAMYGLFAVGRSSTALMVGNFNDWLAVLVYGLALPVVPAMHAIVRETGQTRSLVLATVGAAGLVITIVLQWLLASGRMTFAEQIGYVSMSLLAVGVWLVGTGYLAKQAGALPSGLRDGILGAVHVGYPVWALNLGRRLLRNDD